MWINRTDYQKIVNAGLNTGDLGFVEKIANQWLEEFPNDIKSEYFLAKAAHLLEKEEESAKYLTKILLKDPENLEAYELLSKNQKLKDKKAVASFIYAISGHAEAISSIFPWAVTLRAIRNGIRRGDLSHSETLIKTLLSQEEANPLVAIEHCRLSSIKDENTIFTRLASSYNDRWPECIQFKLFKSIALLREKVEVGALNLLHECVALDPEGIVIARQLGCDNELYSLWQVDQKIQIDFQIPSSIAVSLKWDRLGNGEKDVSYNSDERKTLKNSAGLEIGKNSLKKDISRDFLPVYVILSTYNGLNRKYGEKTTEYIIEHLNALGETINKRQNWESIVFLPDMLKSVQPLGISPISKVDAWQIKLSIHDLDGQLRKQSKMIGAILIVGGKEIVPFHNLPNPTEDSDRTVPSDNPYGTTTSNYLLQEWPIGRLPDEKGSDPGLLLEQIRHIQQFHASCLSSGSKVEQFFASIRKKLDIPRFFTELFKSPRDFGYTAAVWQRSSLAAFRPIGKGSDLRVSPQYDADTIDIDNLMKAKCAYFNLHGLPNVPVWYGQRDFSEGPEGPDFPIAIQASQIRRMRNNVDLIFTEACYGGNIEGKTIDDSMALKLISVGGQGLVASTCISYGSVFTPLIGADLLGFIFWKHIKDGYTFGESLLQAKLGLIKVMNQRQGFLDGEDQKTLLSFVLYGDPLGYLEPHIYLDKGLHKKHIMQKEINLVSDQDGIPAINPRISPSKANEISEMVQSYIPGINNLDVKIREHQIKFRKLMENAKGFEEANGGNHYEEIVKKFVQMQYSQKTKGAHEIHEQFIRVTLDESEKIIKLAVSR